MEVSEDGQKGKIKTTDENGKITISGLNVGKTYTIKELKSPNEYELNTDEIRFIATEENGELQVTLLNGTPRKIAAIQAQGDEGYKIQVEVQDVVKPSIRILKTEQGTDNIQSGVQFRLTGKNFAKGRIFVTNTEGIAILKGLSVGEEYALEETKSADGFQVMQTPVKFTITYEDGNYSLNITEGTVKSSEMIDLNNIPTASFSIENEKLPTFNLNIHKVVKGEET